MAAFPWATVSGVFSLVALVVCSSATLAAAPQGPAEDLPVSVERIREELAKPPPTALKLDMPLQVQVPVPTFKTRVDQRVFVLPLEDWLEKELKLTGLQRQSADWGARCCGINLDQLFKSLDDALKRRKVRKTREQIARELAELEAARKKANFPDR
jgi:hypothetical protein